MPGNCHKANIYNKYMWGFVRLTLYQELTTTKLHPTKQKHTEINNHKWQKNYNIKWKAIKCCSTFQRAALLDKKTLFSNW